MPQRDGFSTTSLFAPFAGVVVPLDEVPDPAFAQRLAGDGIAIDPLDQKVVAPSLWDMGLLLVAPAALIGCWWIAVKEMQGDNRAAERLDTSD